MDPTLMKWLKPIFLGMAHPRMELHRAPLWEMKARLPGWAQWGAKLACNLDDGQRTPRQLGPR